MRLILQATQTIEHLILWVTIIEYVIIIDSQIESLSLFQWFYDNQMKANSGKCHFILTTNDKVK